MDIDGEPFIEFNASDWTEIIDILEDDNEMDIDGQPLMVFSVNDWNELGVLLEDSRVMKVTPSPAPGRQVTFLLPNEHVQLVGLRRVLFQQTQFQTVNTSSDIYVLDKVSQKK
jgi:hypothetical protein